jgi:DNA processing protein
MAHMRRVSAWPFRVFGLGRRGRSSREQPMDLENMNAIKCGDVRYPTALAAIHDPPPTLWIRGNADALHTASVAIVGSRTASPYALEVARRLGADLARRKVTVVSGMARGVDSAAHQGALDGGGVTIAVFGCGADVIYPSEHAGLAAQICERGAIVSEFPPGTIPVRWNFPKRNRVISGLSLAVVVVEAAEGSGSLITAEFALEQGRAVLAVPGNILGGRNYGAHALLRDGAKLVESADDILEEIAVPRSGIWNSGLGQRLGSEPGGGNPASQDPVLRWMTEGEAYDLDELSRISGLDRVKLLPRLLELELASAVRRVEGGRFVRFRGTC